MQGNVDRLSIRVDARIELLLIVQTLVPLYAGNLSKYESRYRAAVLERFYAYRRHAAPSLFKEMIAEGSTSDAYPELMLYLSNPPWLRLNCPPPNRIKRALRGGSTTYEFIEALRTFYTDSNAAEFLDIQAPLYRQIENEVAAHISDRSTISVLEQYYGWAEGSYTLILSPLVHHGGFGPRILRDDGRLDTYCILGPTSVQNGHPGFLEAEGSGYIWHEFGHSFVNPLTDHLMPEVQRYETLFEPIADEMRTMGYTDWQTCVNEHVIRAVTARLAYRRGGTEAVVEAMERELDRGFPYVRELCTRLSVYEESRDEYPTLREFYPRLLDVFGDITTAA